jgi:1,2-diacylglycerol 3-alpha-glucosyltransferase
MKVLHCCLACFYIDNYGYQENILPKMHKIQGHDVKIIASTETYINNTTIGYVQAKSYLNNDGIHVVRLPYVKLIPHVLVKKLRIYKNLLNEIELFKPDVIFLHDCQFLSIFEIIKYVKRNKNIKLYIDGHSDLINCAKTLISKYILHKIIYKYCVKSVEPFVTKFYGVLPARVEFFKSFYKINPKKVELLVLGFDDTVVDFNNRDKIREKIRNKLGLKKSDFLVITGGKIDSQKQIYTLVEAVSNFKDTNIKLVVFGSLSLEVQTEVRKYLNNKSINFIGWLATQEVYKYFFAADLGVFPGLHSVLWEQAVGCGLPCLFRRLDGFDHIDLGGNCRFLEDISVKSIQRNILKLYNNKNDLFVMQNIAKNNGRKHFSYYHIASRAILP